MFLSFRRSEHALLALAFFVVMVLIVFSTLLYVLDCAHATACYTHVSSDRYFAERGSWDEALGIFINTDGDPSQFAVSTLAYNAHTILSNE